MNTKTKLFLDRTIASTFGYFLNIVVRIVGKIARIDHNLDKDFKTIAICKFKGMGSIIQSTPMIYALRSKYPNAEIIFVSSKSNEAILRKTDIIDTVVTVDDNRFSNFIFSNFKALAFLIRKRPDVYFDLEIYSDYSTLFTTFTLSKNRVGFYLRSSTFRMGIYTHMMLFNTHVPIAQAYLQMSGILGCDVNSTDLFEYKSDLLSLQYANGNYIVINPNASDLRLERRWDKENFIALIKSVLIDFPSFNVLLIGSKDETKYTNEISNQFADDRVIDTSGKTSLDELIFIIKNAKLMITNDTGPMHIAFSTGTRVICLFGPCSPLQYGYHKNAITLYKSVYCSPCVHDFETPPCKGNNSCLKMISQDEVISLTQEVLSDEYVFPQNHKHEIIYKYNEYILGLVNR